MKPAFLAGIALIVFGIIALAYQGITYTSHEQKNVVDIGPLKINATVEKEKTIPLPPVVGVASLIGGIVLVLAASKK